MIYGMITSVIFILAFAYIVLTLANKESGNMKLAGQIIAVLIALVALMVLVFGATGRGQCGMMGERGMKCEMMMEKMEKNPSMMKDMMKKMESKEMMKKGMKK
jgi:hypothetical protein